MSCNQASAPCRPGRYQRLVLIAAGLIILSLPHGRSQTLWDGDANTNAWNTASNWNPNSTPGSATDVVFDNTYVGTLPTTIALGGNRSVGTLTFDSNDPLALIDGSGSRRLDLFGGLITQTATSSGLHELQFNTLRLRDNTTFDINGTGGFNVSSVITEQSGTRNITKSGSGTLSFSAANTYTGTTTVSAGTLAISNASALGSGSTTTVASGGTLALSGGITVATETSLSLTGTGASGTGALHNASGNNLWDGNITLGGATTITSVGGELKIGDQTSFADTLTLGSNTLTFDTNGGNIWVNSIISGTGGVTKTGSGTLTYYADQNTYTGTTSHNDGTFILDTLVSASFDGINGNLIIGDNTGSASSAHFVHGQTTSPVAYELINDASTVTVNSDGWWDLNGQYETVASLTMEGGLASTATATTSYIALGGDLTTNAHSQTSTITGNLHLGSASRTVNVADGSAASDLTISAVVSNGGIVKTGAGTLTLTGANTYTGATQINAGVVNIQSATALGTTAAGTTVASGAQLQIQGGITVTGENLTLSGSGPGSTGAFQNVSGSNTWTGTVSLAADSAIQSASGTLTLSGLISGASRNLTISGSGNTTLSNTTTLNSLIKDGAGTLTATGTQSYNAAHINAGTFVLGAANILADTMALDVSGSGVFSSTGFADTISTLTGNGTVNLTSGASLTLGADSAFTGTFNLAGSTFNLGGHDIDITTLNITGNSVIDFAGVSTLNVANFFIASGATLTVLNWVPGVDFFSVANWTGGTHDVQGSSPQNQVTFNGWSNNDTVWQSIDSQVAVPEPSTYGLISIAAAIALYFIRRKRSQN